MIPLEKFGDKIWICDGPRVRMLTIPFATRMTIIELAPGKLWIHSPIELTATVKRAVDELGEVAFIVAPNKIHSLGDLPWKACYSSAEVWVSPRFEERHPEIPFNGVIEKDGPLAWSREISTVIFAGSRFIDEVVFYHRHSRTLIITDLIQRHEPSEESWFWRVIKGSVGVLGSSGGTARDLQSTFNDRRAARASVEAILRWNFDRVVIAHGECVREDARRTVERAFAWTL